MNKHCKDCVYHHNAGHKEGTRYSHKYNDWCTYFSNKATMIVGHCKINNGKKVKA